ncbi:MAG: hypothetical protein ACQERU_11750 [Bacteroidota bacterium]
MISSREKISIVSDITLDELTDAPERVKKNFRNEQMHYQNYSPAEIESAGSAGEIKTAKRILQGERFGVKQSFIRT